MSTAPQADCDWCWDQRRQQVLSQVGRRPTPELGAIRRREAVNRAGRLGRR